MGKYGDAKSGALLSVQVLNELGLTFELAVDMNGEQSD